MNAIVPYATTGSTADITVGYNGTITPVFTANVAVTAPGVFTYNASGSGEVAAINVSDGSLNTWASGAHWRFRRTLCDRRGADIAGGVPGAVAGLMQINAQIPKGVTPGGYMPVVVTIGDSSTVSDAVWISVSN